MIAATLYTSAAAIVALTESDTTILVAAAITALGGVAASVVAAVLTVRLNERLQRLEDYANDTNAVVNSPRRIGAEAGTDAPVLLPPDKDTGGGDGRTE